MMGWYGEGGGWGGWLLMMLFMVAFWGLVIFALVALFRGTGRSGGGEASALARPDPLQILDERFARGEVDAEEYGARRAALRDAHRGRVS